MNKIGIYLIVNIIDCKVYVGQTKNFDNRTHSYELFNGNDNSNLQSDYNNKELNREFVYFIVANMLLKRN